MAQKVLKLLLYLYGGTFLLMSPLLAESDPLRDFHWKYRIILMTMPKVDKEEVVSYLKSDQAAIDERDILWFLITEDSLSTNHREAIPESFQAAVQRRYFESSEKKTQVLLIGKDGGLKSREDTLNLTAIYGRIDAMPMRRQEIKEN